MAGRVATEGHPAEDLADVGARKADSSRLQLRKTITREKILAEAGTLFSARGFEATSMQEVAKAADIGVGTLYGYFASKEVMLQEVLRSDVAAAIETYQATIGAAVGHLDRILLALRFLSEYIDRNRPTLRAALQIHHARHAARAEPLEWVFQGFRLLLATGIEAGELRAVPVDTTARLLVGSYLSAGLGLGVWEGAEGEPQTWDELREVVTGLLTPR